MSRHRKAHAKSKQAKTRKWLIAASVLFLIVLISTAAYIWYPKNPANNIPDNTPAGLKTLANHYIDIMKNLNSTQTRTQMAAQLNPAYNQTDLFAWEQTKLTFENDLYGHETPAQILGSGKGICVQWSIVYVSACLSLGYQSRLVAAVDTSAWNYIHVWAEDYVDGAWVHVDPSDKVWNTPSRYLSWDWGSEIGSGVKVYAFEDNAFQDVTSAYGLPASGR